MNLKSYSCLSSVANTLVQWYPMRVLQLDLLLNVNVFPFHRLENFRCFTFYFWYQREEKECLWLVFHMYILFCFFYSKRKTSAEPSLDLQYSSPCPLLSLLGHDSYDNQDLKELVISSSWYLNITVLMQQSHEFMADLWGMSRHQLPNTKLPIDCVWSIPQQAVGMLWLPSDSTVEEIQGICLWPQNLWGHAEVLRERQGAGEQFRACWVSSFLFVLFVLFWDFTWEEERVEREFWKVFSSGVPLLPLKYRPKLLLSSMGTEANAEYFYCYRGRGVCMFRSVNVQLNRIFKNALLKCTWCCCKRAFCSRLNHCFYAEEERGLLSTGCEFIAKPHRTSAANFFGGSATLLLYITSIARPQTVFKQCFSTCNLQSICDPRNIQKYSRKNL